MIDLMARRRMMMQAQGGGLPEGYTQLEYVYSSVKRVDTGISPIGTTWRCTAQATTKNANTKMFVGTKTGGGHFFSCTGDWWALGSGYNTSASVDDKQTFEITFAVRTISVNIGGANYSRSAADQGAMVYFLSIPDGYHWYGNVYEIECISGGKCHLIPAERDADAHKGLYDVENDVFYDLT